MISSIGVFHHLLQFVIYAVTTRLMSTFIQDANVQSYFHTIAAISPCTSEKLAEPALGCAGSDSDLCKTCSVLLISHFW
jgi:hypothetical protein